MKIILTITSSLSILTGFLAILASLPTAEYYADTYGIVGGIFFLVQGALMLVYLYGDNS